MYSPINHVDVALLLLLAQQYNSNILLLFIYFNLNYCIKLPYLNQHNHKKKNTEEKLNSNIISSSKIKKIKKRDEKDNNDDNKPHIINIHHLHNNNTKIVNDIS